MRKFTQDSWKMYRYTLEEQVFNAGFGSEWDTLYPPFFLDSDNGNSKSLQNVRNDVLFILWTN